jgi:hypothetical protein
LTGDRLIEIEMRVNQVDHCVVLLGEKTRGRGIPGERPKIAALRCIQAVFFVE